MPRLIVHPGAPKTATTVLQHVLTTNRDVLASHGIGVLSIDAFRGHSLLGGFLQYYRGRTDDVDREALAEFFAPYMKFDLVIVSEETFCHDFMPNRKLGDGGIDRADLTASYLAQWPFDDIQIVLTLRQQWPLLVSTYTHFVHRHREYRGFETWLREDVDASRLSWRQAVSPFVNMFGRDAVSVVPFEVARSVGIGGYIAEFLSACGIPDELQQHMNLSVTEVHNPSLSPRALDLCLLLNPRIPRPDRSEAVNTFLLNTFTAEEFGKFEPELSVPFVLPEFIRRENATLANEFFPEFASCWA